MTQHGCGRQIGHEGADTAADGRNDLAAAVDDGYFLGLALFTQTRQAGDLGRFWHLGQLQCDAARFCAQVGQRCIERGAPQRQPGFERRFDTYVEPGLDRARHELHRHDVDHGARQDADEGEQQHQPRHQPGAEFATLVAPAQTRQQQRNQRQQGNGDQRIEHQQLGIVLIEECGVFGCRRQQEQQDADDCAADDQEVTQEPLHVYSAL